jgi:hypothetical protein
MLYAFAHSHALHDVKTFLGSVHQESLRSLVAKEAKLNQANDTSLKSASSAYEAFHALRGVAVVRLFSGSVRCGNDNRKNLPSQYPETSC